MRLFRVLLALLLVIPALEIWSLVQVGRLIGGLNTVLLVILTGAAGAWMAKSQGMKVLQAAQRELQYGRIPGNEILDGIAVLAGGLLLLTPGFLTDIAGFFLLFPPSRRIFRLWFIRWLKKKIRSGDIHFIYYRRW